MMQVLDIYPDYMIDKPLYEDTVYTADRPVGLTQEMIDAGAAVLRAYRTDEPAIFTSEEVVERVWRAIRDIAERQSSKE